MISSSLVLQGRGMTFESYFHGSSLKTAVVNSLKSVPVSVVRFIRHRLTLRTVRNRTDNTFYRFLAHHAVGHLGVWETPIARANAITEVKRSRDANGSA